MGGARSGPADDIAGERPRRGYEWALLAIGWLVVGVGVLGAFGAIPHFAGTVPWIDLARWAVGLALVHDLVVGPAVAATAALLARVVPWPARGALAGGAIVSVVVVAVSWPRLRGYGLDPGEPSLLAGNAARDVLGVLAGVWLVTLGVVVVGALLRRRETGSGS
jgi:hypothetical protein